jgi:hypothetical protein
MALGVRTGGNAMSAAQLAEASPVAASWREVSARVRHSLLSSAHIKRAAAAIWMNLLIALVVGTAAVTNGLSSPAVTAGSMWSVRALTVFAIWLVSFLPGWLYVRFLGLRADALWNEYVLNLYRLGVDDVRYLPPPPVESGYAELAHADAGGLAEHNIYRQKFNAYYGRQVSKRSGSGETFCVKLETMFPVFLCTATLAVAWTVILWDPVIVMDPVQPWAGFEFGFMGAYAFAVSMLVRRFYQSDLRPSAYAAVVLRIVVVMLILAVLHQLFSIAESNGALADGSELVAAFVVGFFPLVGLQAVQRVTAKLLHVVVPQMAPEYPLEQLDGLNIWYEARLVEEGVEDMQNLTTMNLVDVILHTRAPVGRLVDWLDQAFLLIHLDRTSRDDLERARKSADDATAGAATRLALRRIGVRSATDLLKAFGTGRPGQPSAHQPIARESMLACGLDPSQIEMLLRLLDAEPGLDPVWNWKAGGASRAAAAA